MNALERAWTKLSFRGQKKVRILRQLQRLIKSGVTLQKALTDIRLIYSKKGRKPKEPLAMMIGEWQAKLKAGKSLSQSMHGWVSTAEEMIIEAGEQSEQLASSLEDAMTANGAASKIKKAIIGGLIYPVILVCLMIAMIYFFATNIVPTFATILPPEEWTGNPAFVYSMSQFVADYIMLGIMGLGVIITAVSLSFPILVGPLRKVLDRLPPWSIYKITQGASFMIAMRGFLSANMQIPEAMRKMHKSGNPYFKERISAMLAKINSGRNLGEAMEEAGHNFPDNEIASEVSIYAGLDNFAESLDILAKEWIEGAIEKAQAAAKVINMIMLFVIAGCVGYIAISISQIQQLITAGAGM